MKKVFVLLGEDACCAYEGGGIDELIHRINEHDIGHSTLEYDLEELSKVSLIAMVLHDSEGYWDYAFMSEEDYDKLNDSI
jgi:hypothetical protein